MDTADHTLPTLFAQLGLSSDEADIREFIGTHRPLAPAVKLHEAQWWNDSQSAFLLEAIEEDAAWAEVVDELDALLRHSTPPAAEG